VRNTKEQTHKTLGKPEVQIHTY